MPWTSKQSFSMVVLSLVEKLQGWHQQYCMVLVSVPFNAILGRGFVSPTPPQHSFSTCLLQTGTLLWLHAARMNPPKTFSLSRPNSTSCASKGGCAIGLSYRTAFQSLLGVFSCNKMTTRRWARLGMLDMLQQFTKWFSSHNFITLIH